MHARSSGGGLGLVVVLVAWACAGLVLVGAGAFVARRLFAFEPKQQPWTWWFWTGFATLVAVASVAHFVVPIGAWIFAALAPVAILGWSHPSTHVAPPRDRTTALFLVLAAIVAVEVVAAAVLTAATVWVLVRFAGRLYSGALLRTGTRTPLRVAWRHGATQA